MVYRTREMAQRDLAAARAALRLRPTAWPAAYLTVAEARQQMPSASWTEVGASIGMTGDAAAGYFWRIRERLGQMEILRQRRLDALAKIAEAAAELEQIEREIEALPPFRWTHADGGD